MSSTDSVQEPTTLRDPLQHLDNTCPANIPSTTSTHSNAVLYEGDFFVLNFWKVPTEWIPFSGPPPQPLYPKTASKKYFNSDLSIRVRWPTDVTVDDTNRMRMIHDQMTAIERNCVRSIGNRADYCFLVSRRTPAAHVLHIRIACCLRASVSSGTMHAMLREGCIIPAMMQGLDVDAKRAFKAKMQDLHHINIEMAPLASHHLFDAHHAATDNAENDQVQVLLSRYPRQLVGRRIGTSKSCESSSPSPTTMCRAFEIKITFPLSDDSDLQGALNSIKDVLTRSTQNCFIVWEACSPLASVVCACTYATATTQRSLQKQKFKSISQKLDTFSVLSPCVSVEAMIDHTMFHAFRETLSGATVLHCR
jgi:hypothetical protein